MEDCLPGAAVVSLATSVAEALPTETPERRAFPRVSTADWTGMSTGRLRPGRSARIVDVSPGGVLLETECRLFPGMRVELQLGSPTAPYRVKATVLRCHVATLTSGRVQYHGALAFADLLALQ